MTSRPFKPTVELDVWEPETRSCQSAAGGSRLEWAIPTTMQSDQDSVHSGTNVGYRLPAWKKFGEILLRRKESARRVIFCT